LKSPRAGRVCSGKHPPPSQTEGERGSEGWPGFSCSLCSWAQPSSLHRRPQTSPGRVSRVGVRSPGNLATWPVRDSQLTTPPRKTCTWTIQVPEGRVVILSFRHIDLEMDPICRYDHVSVYNGDSVSAERLGRFCGTFRPGAVMSTSNTMVIEMGSDADSSGKGFLALYTAGLPPDK
ncbi:procollagen C-endopeptidase enhancer 2-like, partial [Chiloscyllium punctatum]|uniref:procollagen C-endopeptidase enhancer 2-like n=1 Tax=Chiloscyllium punctatum TaxID=137246 RepID=UPI003B63B853